jgi:hypothetical protein
VGHTHNLQIIQFDGKDMTRSPLPKGVHPGYVSWQDFTCYYFVRPVSFEI